MGIQIAVVKSVTSYSRRCTKRKVKGERGYIDANPPTLLSLHACRHIYDKSSELPWGRAMSIGRWRQCCHKESHDIP
ncbi:hypothetical protein J6590_082408 [Homalodisca vitripennis]|nr:hypothetical protein J6590_082408 [Homalodisca vitripennis]